MSLALLAKVTELTSSMAGAQIQSSSITESMILRNSLQGSA